MTRMARLLPRNPSKKTVSFGWQKCKNSEIGEKTSSQIVKYFEGYKLF